MKFMKCKKCDWPHAPYELIDELCHRCTVDLLKAADAELAKLRTEAEKKQALWREFVDSTFRDVPDGPKVGSHGGTESTEEKPDPAIEAPAFKVLTEGSQPV